MPYNQHISTEIIDWSAVQSKPVKKAQVSYDVNDIPAGIYTVEVSYIALKDTARNDGQYYKVSFAVVEPTHLKGRLVFINYTKIHRNPKAVEIGMDKFKSLSIAATGGLVKTIEELKGKKLKIELKIREGNIKDETTGERYPNTHEATRYMSLVPQNVQDFQAPLPNATPAPKAAAPSMQDPFLNDSVPF